MSDALVTIRRVSLPIDAQLIGAQLRGAGIDAVILDDEMATINPLVVDAMGGVRVQVREAEVERALEILAVPLIDDDDDLADLSMEGRCPRCRSEYTASDWTWLQKASSLPLLFVPLFFVDRSMHCQQCRHVWKESELPRRAPKTPYRSLARKRSDTRPVFRLRRDSSVQGLLTGAILSTAIAIAMGDGRWVVLATAGWLFGRARTTDVCSEPSCRAPLAHGSPECPTCKGSVQWVIRQSSEHFAARAEWRQSDRASPKAIGPRATTPSENAETGKPPFC
jgi:hypothetical protein